MNMNILKRFLRNYKTNMTAYFYLVFFDYQIRTILKVYKEHIVLILISLYPTEFNITFIRSLHFSIKFLGIHGNTNIYSSFFRSLSHSICHVLGFSS